MDEILKEYDINKLAYNGYIYVEIQKGIYGLKEAGILAYTALVKYLQPYGYYPVRYTPGIWCHKTTDIIFTLAVDDFGINFYTKCHAEHLYKALGTKYDISTDWTGNHYCGLAIDWNYNKAYMDISIPGYVQAALQRFQHLSPTKPQQVPHSWATPSYGFKVDYALPPSTLILDKNGKRYNESTELSCTIQGQLMPVCYRLSMRSQHPKPNLQTLTKSA